MDIIDTLAAHGVYTDTADLLPHYSQEEDDVHTYDVLRISTHVEDGSQFLPYVHTQGLLELRELSWKNNGQTSSVTHLFSLRDPSNTMVIVQQIINLLTDKGQQFDS